MCVVLVMFFFFLIPNAKPDFAPKGNFSLQIETLRDAAMLRG